MKKRWQERAHREASFNESNRDRWVAAKAQTVAPHSTVLDVGAGPGRYRALFAHCDYRAQDLAEYQGPPGYEWQYTALDYVSDAAAIPVESGTFDAVLCTEVLEHVPEPIAVIREISRILRPGGRLFLTAPLGSGLHQEPYHFYGGYTPYFYRKFLPEAGFQIVAVEPNRGFFRHLGQEAHRAGGILLQRYRRRRLTRTAIYYLLCVAAPLWCARLDDDMLIEGFTVGYHVEAVRAACRAEGAR